MNEYIVLREDILEVVCDQTKVPLETVKKLYQQSLERNSAAVLFHDDSGAWLHMFVHNSFSIEETMKRLSLEN
jgi:hypothetical protein